MKNKISRKYNFINWFLGNLFVSMGVCFSTKASFGLSMIAAPAYILHVYLRDIFPWYSQGTSEYFFQAAVLLITCLIVKRFKLKYLLSFLAAVISGLFIDGIFSFLGGNATYSEMYIRIISLAAGLILTPLGVACYFRTNFPLQSYELCVVEISARYGFLQHKVKQIFDITLLAISLVLAFTLTKSLTGIGISTLLAVIVNARLIKLWGILIDKIEKTQYIE